MRILKEANIERKHKCKFCHSIFAYTVQDCSLVFKNIRCPVCEQLNKASIFDRKIKENKE